MMRSHVTFVPKPLMRRYAEKSHSTALKRAKGLMYGNFIISGMLNNIHGKNSIKPFIRKRNFFSRTEQNPIIAAIISVMRNHFLDRVNSEYFPVIFKHQKLTANTAPYGQKAPITVRRKKIAGELFKNFQSPAIPPMIRGAIL